MINEEDIDGSYDEWGEYTPGIGDKAVKFGRKYKTPKNRLIAIMKNIIKNKGEFKP